MLTAIDRIALRDLADAVILGEKPERITKRAVLLDPQKVETYRYLLRQLDRVIIDLADETQESIEAQREPDEEDLGPNVRRLFPKSRNASG